MSDARTLRLAYPEITPAELDVFLKAVLPDGEFDLKTLEARGMKLEQAHRIHVAVQAFCGPRRSAQKLEMRLSEAKFKVEAALARKEAPDAHELELAESLPAKLRELRSDRKLKELYSEATLATLQARERELMALALPLG